LIHVYDAIIPAQRRVTGVKISEFWYNTGSVTSIPRKDVACLKVPMKHEPKKKLQRLIIRAGGKLANQR
jgi:hypothetical protein